MIKLNMAIPLVTAVTLLLTGCVVNSTEDQVRTALTYCESHGGLRLLRSHGGDRDVSKEIICNNGSAITMIDAKIWITEQLNKGETND